jgi:hypothetical protein
MVVAAALGARLSLLLTTLNLPFDNRLLLAMFLGGVFLCPLVFFKQFVFEHRSAHLRFGEWLWISFFLWFSLVWLLLSMRSVFGFFLLFGGLFINPLLLVGVCINVALLQTRREARPTLWSDVAGRLITAILSVTAIFFLLHLPPF